MKRLHTTLILLILTTTLFGQKTNKIEVIQAYSKPIPNCKIELIHLKKSKKNQIGITDSNGIAIFKKINLKHYKIKVTPNGNIYNQETINPVYSSKIYLTYQAWVVDSLKKQDIKLKNSWERIDNYYDSINKIDSLNISDSLDTKAKYPGGYSEMTEFILNNINYPQMAFELGLEGKVYVEFKIQKDGQVSHVKILQSDDSMLNEEAIKVIRKMPNWIPAEYKGAKVISLYTIPIIFNLK